MIGVWVKLLSIPYRYLYPSAMFFVCIGVYAATTTCSRSARPCYRRGRLHPAASGFPSGPILLGFVLPCTLLPEENSAAV